MTYLTLFLSALVAATILPAQSEAVLVWHITNAPNQAAVLVAVASLGNVLGAVINWGIGRGINRGINQGANNRLVAKIAPPEKITKAEAMYRRYGRFSLLASWVPFIGDPLTVIAGVLREPLWSFLLIVTIAKSGRYIVLALLTLGLI